MQPEVKQSSTAPINWGRCRQRTCVTQSGGRLGGLFPRERSGLSLPLASRSSPQLSGTHPPGVLPALWNSAGGSEAVTPDPGSAEHQHTSGNPANVAIPVLNNGQVIESHADPFDGYVLRIPNATEPPSPANTNQFTQMEANMSLFFGLAVHAWVTMLVPDDSPMDRFFDANPDSHTTFGESGEPRDRLDLLNCGQTNRRPDSPRGNHASRPREIPARSRRECQNQTARPENPAVVLSCRGRHAQSGARVDPLMGMDFFPGIQTCPSRIPTSDPSDAASAMPEGR